MTRRKPIAAGLPEWGEKRVDIRVEDQPLVDAWVRWSDIAERAAAELAGLDSVTVDNRGQRVRHPAALVLADATKHLLALADALGHSPAARERLGISAATHEDDDETLDLPPLPIRRGEPGWANRD